MPDAKAAGTNGAQRLFVSFCSQLDSVQVASIDNPIKRAILENAIKYLKKRFGTEVSEEAALVPAKDLSKKIATWSITTLQGRHKRKIEVLWDPKTKRLKISISGNASGKKLGAAKIPVYSYHLDVETSVSEILGPKKEIFLKANVSNEALINSKVQLSTGKGTKSKQVSKAKSKTTKKINKLQKKRIKAVRIVRPLFRQFCSRIKRQKPKIKDKLHRAIWDINSKYLASFGTEEPGEITIPATAELEKPTRWSFTSLQGKHKRKVEVSWNKKKEKLYIDIEGNADGKKIGDGNATLNNYRESIEVGVVAKKDNDGNTKLALKKVKEEKKPKDILTFKLDKIGSSSGTDIFYESEGGYASSIKVFARECDKNGFLTAINQINVNGRWIGENVSNSGDGGGVWIISHSPLKCENPQASVVLTYINGTGYKKVFKGEIRDWKIIAKYVIHRPEDMDIPKPLEVRRKLAARKEYTYKVELALRRDKDGGIFLDGKWQGLLVRYSRNLFGDYDIKWVGPGYEEPLQLTRDNSQGNYKITRIRIDISSWKKKLSTLRSKISKLEDELKSRRDELSFYKKKLNHALKEFAEAKRALEKRAKKLSKIQSRLDEINKRLLAPRLTPKKMSRGLKALLERLEKAEIELEVVSDKKKKETLKREIFALNEFIKKKYRDLKFDPKKERIRLKKEVKKLDEEWEKVMDEYWSIKIKKFDGSEAHIKFWGKNYEDTLNEINKIESEIADLKPRLQMLDQRDTPFVSKVVISDEYGEYEAQWMNWGPFRGLELIDKEVERSHKLLRESKRELERAKRNHEKAFEEAQDALYGVTKAIMRSAYFQAAVESGFYFYDVFVKGWGKGGPLGALTEALGKAAESLILNQGGVKFAEVSNKEVTSLEAEIAREQGFDLENTGEASKTGPKGQRGELKSVRKGLGASLIEKLPLANLDSITFKRVAKDTAFKYGKTQTNKYLMAQVTSYLANHAENKLINGVRKKLADETLWQMSKRCVKLNNYVDKLLSEKTNVTLEKIAWGIVKDFSKSTAKNIIKCIEERAWINYFEKDIKARIACRARIAASRAYWEAYDKYMMWKTLKKLLAENYDPESNFQGPGPYPLEEGKTYIVKLELRNPKGRREKVFIDGLEAKPIGDLDNHRFEFVAAGFNKKTGKNLVMKINFLE